MQLQCAVGEGEMLTVTKNRSGLGRQGSLWCNSQPAILPGTNSNWIRFQKTSMDCFALWFRFGYRSFRN